MPTAFSEAIFPVDIAYGATSTPRYLVSIEGTEAGFERRTLRWENARREFDVATGITSMAREDGDDAQRHLGMLISFFHAMRGPLTGFRFKDWSDYSSAPDHISEPLATDQVLGIGDGETTAFDIYKRYQVIGSGTDENARRIHKILPGSVRVAVGGLELTADQFAVDVDDGRIVFSVPPPPGAVVTCGFEFFVPVRFSAGTLPVRLDAYEAGSATVELVEVRL